MHAVTYPAFRVLYWLATAPGQQHPPTHVIPTDDRRAVYDELVHAQDIEATLSNDGSFSFVLTEAGRVTAGIVKTEYRPELAKRCILDYLSEYPDAGLGDLSNSDRARNDYTGPLSSQEIQDAADELDDLGMISGRRDGDRRFFTAKLTGRGKRAHRGPSPIGGPTTVIRPETHQHTTTNNFVGTSQIAQHTGGNVTQTQVVDNSTAVAPGYEDLARITQALIDRLPQLQLGIPDDEDIRAHADTILGEVVNDQPDPGRLRRALNGIRALLEPLATGVKQAVTAEASDLARHTLDQIADLTQHLLT